MGFNFGAFAGGAGQSALSTYKTMADVESQAKRDELIDLQMQEAKLAMQERADLKTAGGVYNKVGGQDYAPELQRTAGIGAQQAQGLAVNTGAGGDEFDRAVNESTQGVLREAAGRQGAALPTDAAMKPAAYTREQADTDYLAKVRGINPERALDVENKQIQTATGRSGLARIKAEDEFSTWHQASLGEIQKDPVGWVRAHQDEYNKAKSGHLNDNYTGKVVESADKQSASFVRTDAKGKLVDSTPIDKNTAAAALEHVAFSRFASLPGKFKESAELGLRGKEVGYKGEEVDIKRARMPFENAKDAAYTTYLGGGGKGGGGGAAGKAIMAQQLVDNKDAPDLPTAYRILASKDSRSYADQQWATTRGELVKAGAKPEELARQREMLYAEHGVAPAALADAIRTGINPATAKPWPAEKAKEIVAGFNTKYPASAVPMASITWASPTEAKQTALSGGKTRGSATQIADDMVKAGTATSRTDAFVKIKEQDAAAKVAAADAERKRAVAEEAQSAKMRSAIALDFSSKYGR